MSVQIGDYKCLLGASTYNLKSISILWLNKVWPLEIITITFTQDFIPYFKNFDTSSHEHCVACVQGTCSKDIRVNTFDMQTFTRFYGKFAYYGLISDFSTSSWFLFVKLILGFQVWFQWFRPECTRFHWVSDPSTDPFCCPYCHIQNLTTEISTLKITINSLNESITTLHLSYRLANTLQVKLQQKTHLLKLTYHILNSLK